MVYTVTPPSVIRTSIQLPASKSISNRLLILNALSHSPYPIDNLSDSDDTQVLLKTLQSTDANFDTGAAGTSMRFSTAYLAQKSGMWTITGSERMKHRPIRILVEALRSIGAEIAYLEKEGYPPLRIAGRPLKGGAISLNGSVSSQYISALMMIAPCLQEGLRLHLEGSVISRPYIQMTIDLMALFGIAADWQDSTITIAPQTYQPVPLRVESDWSAASYWLEIQALAGENAVIELLGLSDKSVQGDAAIREIMKRVTEAHGLVEVDFVDTPDLAQTVVVTCCLLNIPFHFTGLQSLRIKETDRITALQTELRKLGYVLSTYPDALVWTGEMTNRDAQAIIDTYEDHRMAMAFAPACLKLGEVRIADPGVVTKSYPAFWNDLKQAGFHVV